MLPYQPETIEAALLRFPAALVREYDLAKLFENPEDRPGLKRENVFDFNDGIRMIASIDRQDEWRRLHLSFSIYPEFITPAFSLVALMDRIRDLCVRFGGSSKPIEQERTLRAFHFTFPVPESLARKL